MRLGPQIHRLLLAMLLALAPASRTRAEPPQLPPIVEPASNEHHVGKVIFVELVTPDLVAAERFYGGLFGWSFRHIEGKGIDYAEATLDDRVVAGLVQRRIAENEHRQPAWLTFIAARDVDAAKDVAVKRGARLLFGPRNLPDRGREAVLADPQGAVFALLASSSGDPPDYLAEPGEWIWSSLITKDPDTDAGFYQTLFDYEVFELSDNPSREHLLLATDGYARASVNPFPVSRPDMLPHWLNFVRVEDAAAASAKAQELGGRVVVEPRPDRHGGKIAVVVDPSGAPFGLLEWSASESKELPQ